MQNKDVGLTKESFFWIIFFIAITMNILSRAGQNLHWIIESNMTNELRTNKWTIFGMNRVIWTEVTNKTHWKYVYNQVCQHVLVYDILLQCEKYILVYCLTPIRPVVRLFNWLKHVLQQTELEHMKLRYSMLLINRGLLTLKGAVGVCTETFQQM